MRKAIIAACICAAWMIQSCGKAPFACFTTDLDRDKIHVNQPVTFAANCTSNASDYFWQFYGNEDSTEFGYSVTKVFKNPGKVEVFLLVSGGHKTSTTTDSIMVLP
jgi:PKD repeat protein